MNLEDMLSEQKPVTKRQILYESSYGRYLRVVREPGCRVVVARGCGKREWQLLFNGYKVSVLQDENCFGEGWWTAA